ncbi:MAG TPA: hypothetical protein VE422_33855 [Terriglobia bacterium]|nr:hypothetical protein [Terriglobia bacterium]
MKLLALVLTFLISQQIPKNNPNGVWEADTGSQYELRLSGSDLHVKMVSGSNSKFLQYEVDMTNEKEINTYKGTGFFVAKMEGGKECKLATEWQFVVVSNDRIIGAATAVIADQKTCQVLEKNQVQIDLKKRK